jgi:hypothetical protein
MRLTLCSLGARRNLNRGIEAPMSGPHTLRIVTLGKADSRSPGRVVAIDHAVVYRGL